MVFTYMLQPGQNITIRQSSNSFDSVHEMRVGGACPGDDVLQTVDDPDISSMFAENSFSYPFPVYYLISGFSATSSGSYTLEWEILGAGEQLSTQPFVDPCISSHVNVQVGPYILCINKA